MALVSIIIPLHDKGAYVADTIRSVLRQTVADWEVIVVENGSSDDGPEKVRSFDDPRVRLEISPKVGPGASRNHGLSLACGRWILFLDADDLLGPGYLSSRLALMKSNPSSDLLVGRWIEFTDTSAGNGTIRLPEGEAFGEAWLRDASIAFAPWAVHAALIRRDLLADNPWPEHLDPFASEDTAFWFPLLQSHSVAFTLDASAFYRILDGNSRNRPEAAFWTDSVKMVTSCNVEFLRQSGHRPNARQALFLMKAFESCYQLAIQERDQKTASKALGLARQWLSQCRVWSRAALFRRILGIPFHHRVMGLIFRIVNPAKIS